MQNLRCPFLQFVVNERITVCSRLIVVGFSHVLTKWLMNIQHDKTYRISASSWWCIAIHSHIAIHRAVRIASSTQHNAAVMEAAHSLYCIVGYRPTSSAIHHHHGVSWDPAASVMSCAVHVSRWATHYSAPVCRSCTSSQYHPSILYMLCLFHQSPL